MGQRRSTDPLFASAKIADLTSHLMKVAVAPLFPNELSLGKAVRIRTSGAFEFSYVGLSWGLLVIERHKV
jgi:hypothetical protein